MGRDGAFEPRADAALTSPKVTPALVVSPSGDDSLCRRSILSTPCRTFQHAYDLAQPGDVVSVMPGVFPANDPRRDAVTIFGAPKRASTPVTFTCASTQPVTHASGWFTIKASNVTLQGSCFNLHALRIGEPGDTTLTTQNIVVDGAHMEGLEVAGARGVALRNVEVGPNVYCYKQGTAGRGPDGGPVTPAMWCDPAGPSYESVFANRGTADLPLQPYFHNNAGGINPTAVVEGSYIHDLQTKDAFNLHTGCGLIWTIPGSPSNSIVFRNDRFENCAVLGLLFDHADGVTITGNWFGYPTLPLSNGKGDDVEAPLPQREVVLKTGGSGAGWMPRNWLISFNSFSHGLSLDGSAARPTFTNVVVRRNLLGTYSYCPPGVVFDANLFEGRSCAPNSLKVPFGYVLTGHRLVPSTKPAQVVRSVFRLASGGLAPSKVAKTLRASNQAWLKPSTVRDIVRNDLYLGSMLGPKGATPALVKRAVWLRAQRSLTR